MKELTHLALFAGIGGDTLACQWAGFRTIGFVEIDEFCQKVLAKNFPGVPIWGDIRDVTGKDIMANAQGREPREQEARNRGQDTSRGSKEKSLAYALSDREVRDKPQDWQGRGIEQEGKAVAYAQSNGFRQGRTPSGDEIQQENRTAMPQVGSRDEYGSRSTEPAVSPITLITGGFPCQPVSGAGKRKGKADDRWLWPEMLRIISEVRPAWVVAENVAGLLNMGFNDCVSDLESEGYETIPFLIPACAINAPHRRDRIFIVAHTEQSGVRGEGGEASNERGETSQEGREGIRQGNRAIGTSGVAPAGNDAYPPSLRRNIRGSNRQGRHLLSDKGIAEEGKQERERRLGGVSSASKNVADTIIGTERSPYRKGSDQGRPDSKQDDRDSLGDDLGNGGENAPDPQGIGIQGNWPTREQKPGIYAGEGLSLCGGSRDGAVQWAVEPELGRVAYGIPNRVDRLKGLGNAIVPQQIYPIVKAIAEIEANLP